MALSEIRAFPKKGVSAVKPQARKASAVAAVLEYGSVGKYVQNMLALLQASLDADSEDTSLRLRLMVSFVNVPTNGIYVVKLGAWRGAKFQEHKLLLKEECLAVQEDWDALVAKARSWSSRLVVQQKRIRRRQLLDWENKKAKLAAKRRRKG